MGRMKEIAADALVVDQVRDLTRSMSKEALLMQIGFMAADLRRLVLSKPGCLSHEQEAQVQTIRMDLESVARIGGECEAYIEGTAASPMPSLMQNALVVDQVRDLTRSMSKEALLMQIGFMAADLRRLVLSKPGCLSHEQEAQVQTIRMDLESVARIGGECEAYIEGTAASPMPSLMQAAE